MTAPPTPALADPAFLASLKSLCPPSLSTSDPESPNAVSTHLWALVAAVAFSAANAPEAVPAVFAYDLAALSAAQEAAGTPKEEAEAEQMVFARKIREGVLQAGLLSGMPRSINSLVALHEATPEHLRETQTLRDTTKPLAEWDKRGDEMFRAVYQDGAAGVQKKLHDAYPDLGWFCTTVGYGLTYGGTRALTLAELVYVQVAALVAADAPVQAAWHLANARRRGAPPAETRAVRALAVAVASRAGVVWRAGVPEVEEVEVEESE